MSKSTTGLRDSGKGIIFVVITPRDGNQSLLVNQGTGVARRSLKAAGTYPDPQVLIGTPHRVRHRVLVHLHIY